MKPEEKTTLHPRNLHRHRYDFKALTASSPLLRPFVFINQYGSETIDFADPAAVKMLNKALLELYYGIKYWNIPAGYLCPPIPSRADYVHHMADLLNHKAPKPVTVLDIGTGANCIYPIIGVAVYGWQFVGSDVDARSLQSANEIIKANASLRGQIDLRQQVATQNIFKGIIASDDFFELTICNPPFHASAAEAAAGTSRKNKNLGNKNSDLNFGGQKSELWCAGGEEAFIKKMIEESAEFAHQCGWFSTLVSKKENLPSIYHALRWVKATEVKTIEMIHGQKKSRIVAWRF